MCIRDSIVDVRTVQFFCDAAAFLAAPVSYTHLWNDFFDQVGTAFELDPANLCHATYDGLVEALHAYCLLYTSRCV